MYQEYEQMRTSRAMPRGELCLNSYCSLVLTKSISNLIRTHDAQNINGQNEKGQGRRCPVDCTAVSAGGSTAVVKYTRINN